MRLYNKETPISIYLWNQETFGKPSIAAIGARASLEISEFIIAAVNEDFVNMKKELADVAIMLWAVAAGSRMDARPECPRLEERDVLRVEATRLFKYYGIYLERYHHKISKQAATYLTRALETLELLAVQLKVDLPTIVDEKMIINRARKWAKLSEGNHQHVA